MSISSPVHNKLTFKPFSVKELDLYPIFDLLHELKEKYIEPGF